LPIFIAAAVVTRGLRFFAVAWIFMKFGPTVAPMLEKRMGLALGVIFVLIVGGLLAAHYLI